LGEWNWEGEPYEIAASSYLRRNLRKALLKVEQDGGFEFLRAGRFDPGLLAKLNELESTGWKGAEGSPVFQREKDRAFWNEVCAAAQEGGYLAMHAMRRRGRVVAVSRSLNYRKRMFGVKMGWDQELKSYSPGHLLVREILRDCSRGGAAEFHLMGMRSAWKEQWTREALPHATCYVFRSGLFGKVTQAVVSRKQSKQLGGAR
jgi:CelD/BcsL family acetyltransferase involved in cellulose biosynthesis